MPFSKIVFGATKQYSLTNGDEPETHSDPLLPGGSEVDNESQHPAPSSCRSSKIAIVLAQVGVLLIVSLLSYSLGRRLRAEKECLDTVWSELKNDIRFQKQTFNPHFIGPPSEYMGEPNPDVDARWYDITALWNFGADYATIVKANKTKGIIQWPGTSTYQVGIEAFHQLHCLNYIRMYTYLPYYEKIDYDMIAESPEDRREHKDHCVDILRQRLMCTPDLNIYTNHWAKDHELPLVDLTTNHRCIDWDRFYHWAVENAVHSPLLKKPIGAEERD